MVRFIRSICPAGPTANPVVASSAIAYEFSAALSNPLFDLAIRDWWELPVLGYENVRGIVSLVF